MGRKTLTILACCIGVLLFLFVGHFQVFESSGLAYAAVVEPHCTDGDCSDYALWCMSQGRIAMCLNAYTNGEVTVCLGARAMSEIMNNVPNACIGTCYYVHNEAAVCNFDNDW